MNLIHSITTLRLIDIAIVASSGLAALGLFYLHAVWAVLLIVPISLYIYKNKAKTKEEEERRVELSHKSYAFFLVLPVMIIMLFFLYLVFWQLIPAVIHYWQG